MSKDNRSEINLKISRTLEKPIVASNLFGIPEAITDGKEGILVNNDVSEITNAIICLLDDERYSQSLGRNALLTAKKKIRLEYNNRQVYRTNQ